MYFEIFADINPDGSMSDFKRNEARKAFLQFAGKKVRIRIERSYNKRSNNQNRYFHGVVIPVVQQGLIDAGWNEAKSFEWVKDFIKHTVLMHEVVNEKSGEVIKTPRKTSELTTVEFMELVEDVARWASEYLNVCIPLPGEQVQMYS